MTDSGVNVFDSALVKPNPYSFKVEGKSRLTPLQAIFLFELGVSAYCVKNKESQPTPLARLDFIDKLMKVEEDHPDWHFEDFKNWVRETTWDVEK